MKKYFLKYITVDEEILQDDHVLFNNMVCKVINLFTERCYSDDKRLFIEIKLFDGKTVMLHDFKYLIKVKLFLCTRDIKVDDKVRYGYSPNSPEHICESLDGCKANGCWKVIGEISPDATWVKEGDEFYEDDVQAWGVCAEENHHFHNHTWEKDIEYIAKHALNEVTRCCFECDCEIDNRYFKIKGPCGHFH